MHIALLPKASVAIHVGGNALHEYTAESEHPMKATSYVETIDGDEFSVVLKLEPNFTPRYAVSRDDSLRRDNRLVCAISLDGQGVASHAFNAKQMKHGFTKGMDNARDNMDGVSCYRKFTFAQHESSKYITGCCSLRGNS
jgi:hypothetical protein